MCSCSVIIDRLLNLKSKFVKVLRLTLFRKNKMVFLFCSPFHPNMGDHAQTYCIQKWYKENYPEYDFLIFQSTLCSKKILKLIRKYIHKEDKLVCHSGYHLTNLYNEQKVYFWVIQNFYDFPIVIFPQTINYTTTESLNEARKVLNSHPNLTIMCRDEKSYEIAKHHFINAKLLLFPDIVTSLIGTREYSSERSGILFCIRNDVEAYYSSDQIANLRSRFINEYTYMTDTDRFDFSMSFLYNNREKALNIVLKEFSCFNVVVTDRYHGTIFSQITGTPVVVLDSADHKLCSGVKWFPNEIFGRYVYFAKDLDCAFEIVMEILKNRNSYHHKLPPYFRDRFYSHLKEYL